MWVKVFRYFVWKKFQRGIRRDFFVFVFVFGLFRLFRVGGWAFCWVVVNEVFSSVQILFYKEIMFMKRGIVLE